MVFDTPREDAKRGPLSTTPKKMAQLPPANRKSTVVGEYVLGEEIGKGAHGVVYKAISVLTGAVVAVKEISVRGLDETASTALTLEIELLKSLQHENVVRLIGVVKHAAYVYVILEFIENGSLSSLIKPQKFGVMSEQLAKVYVKQVLAGLSFCHANGVVHRDVKGGNILTTKNGVVKICDFGVAMRVDKNGGTGSDIKSKQSSDNKHSKDTGKQSTDKHKNQPVKELDAQGTPYWMAPEVIEMGGAGPASDVWSVGCVVCELLTGYVLGLSQIPPPCLPHLFACTTRAGCSVASTRIFHNVSYVTVPVLVSYVALPVPVTFTAYWKFLRIHHKETVRPDYSKCPVSGPITRTPIPHTVHPYIAQHETDTFLSQSPARRPTSS